MFYINIFLNKYNTLTHFGIYIQLPLTTQYFLLNDYDQFFLYFEFRVPDMKLKSTLQNPLVHYFIILNVNLWNGSNHSLICYLHFTHNDLLNFNMFKLRLKMYMLLASVKFPMVSGKMYLCNVIDS